MKFQSGAGDCSFQNCLETLSPRVLQGDTQMFQQVNVVSLRANLDTDMPNKTIDKLIL